MTLHSLPLSLNASSPLALAALVLLATAAVAAPPPGLRWSDMVGVRGSTVTPARPAAVPRFGYPAFTASPAAVAAGVGADTVGTVTLRGPDGAYRTFPVAASATGFQGAGAQSYVSVRDGDGLVPAYPVALTATPSPVIYSYSFYHHGGCR